MDVDAAFSPGPEPAELMQPGEGPLDRPALCPEPGTVGLTATGDDRGDPAGGERAPVRKGVVGPVGEQVTEPPAWPSPPSSDRRNRLHQHEELGEVVAVPAGGQGGERNPTGFGDQVVFRAWVGTVDQTRTCLGPLVVRGGGRSRPVPGAGRASRRRGTRPAGSRVDAARHRRCASPATAASRSLPPPQTVRSAGLAVL